MGGRESALLPLRDSITCRPSGYPICIILSYPFSANDPKILLKAPEAPMYTYFEGARAKKRNVLVNIFQKMLKNLFCGLLFSESWSKWGLYSDLRELRKTIGSILKKNGRQTFKNLFEIQPPLEKTLYLSLYISRQLDLTSIGASSAQLSLT